MEKAIAENMGKIIFGMLALSIISLISVYVIYYIRFPWIPADRPAWGVAGDFLGGALNPILTFYSFIALLATIVLQRYEMKLIQVEAKLSRLAQEKSEKALSLQSATLQQQLEDSKIATRTAGFLHAVDLMQSEIVREARTRINELRVKKVDFSEWDTSDKREAAKVCQSFDIVGMMVLQGMAPKDVIISGWRTTILNSWQALKPFVQERRDNDGYHLFCQNFENLAKEAGISDSPLIPSFAQ